MSKTILITGASTGFGKLTAQKFQAEGWNVVATMRSPEKETELQKLDNVFVTKLDVTDKLTITNAVKETTDKYGSIDVLLNNAGYGSAGAIETISEEEIRRQFDVNVIGLISVTQAVTPIMRAQKSGIIINISSMGGRITFPLLGIYHSSKFAVEGLTESMQYELNPLGIKMKIIEPGGFKTDFGGRSMALAQLGENHQDYAPITTKLTQAMGAMVDNLPTGEPVADMIFEAATDGSDKLRYPVGDDAIQILAARQQMDDIQFKDMVMTQYGLK